MDDKIRLRTRVSKEVANKYREIAMDLGLSVTAVIEEVLSEYLQTLKYPRYYIAVEKSSFSYVNVYFSRISWLRRCFFLKQLIKDEKMGIVSLDMGEIHPNLRSAASTHNRALVQITDDGISLIDWGSEKVLLIHKEYVRESTTLVESTRVD